MSFLERMFGPPNVVNLQQARKVRALVHALSNSQLEIREHAIVALMEVCLAKHHPDEGLAVSGLLSVVENGKEEARLRQNAACALVDIGNTCAVERLVAVSKRAGERPEFQAEIGRILKRFVDVLISKLNTGYTDGLPTIAHSLGLIGHPAVEPLIAVLKDEHRWTGYERRNIRKHAATVLGKIGDEKAVEALQAAAMEPTLMLENSRDNSVQLAAVQALKNIGGALAIQALAEYDAYSPSSKTPESPECDIIRDVVNQKLEELDRRDTLKIASEARQQVKQLQGGQALKRTNGTDPRRPLVGDEAGRTPQPWTPTNPRLTSHMPLAYLQRIFIFTDGNGQTTLDSPVVVGMLQDTAEAPLKAFLDRVHFDVIARSDVGRKIQQTGQFPESAWAAMSRIDAATTLQAREGRYRSCVRVFEDPRTREEGALVLLYRA